MSETLVPVGEPSLAKKDGGPEIGSQPSTKHALPDERVEPITEDTTPTNPDQDIENKGEQ